MRQPTPIADLVWDPPGPGEWMLDTTHHGRRPLTHYFRNAGMDAFDAIGTMFAKYGLPLAGMATAEVNDCSYIQPRAVGEGDTPKPPPPALLMKIIARLHPEMRRRNAAAREAWATKLWRTEVDQWFDHERDGVVAANRRLTAVDVGSLDDGALIAHIDEVTAHCREQAVKGFEHHGGDIVPVGDYLAHCAGWGIDAGTAAPLLRGASPASVATVEALAPVADALATADPAPTTIEGVRALSDESARAVDEWLDTFGWRVITSDDLDGLTLAEQPELQLRALLAAAAPIDATPPDATAVRSRVPSAERARFDELLAEARYGMRLRDDQVGVRWTWPVGLLRRALLEVGRRLVADGRLHRADHAVDVAPDEVRSLLLERTGPTADQIAARWQRRLDIEASMPPDTLGDPGPPPPFDALPAPMARAARAVMALIDAMESAPADTPDATPQNATVHGVGIGADAFEGVVRLATDADDALARLEAGEVLVTSFTGPAYNAVLPVVGAMVVDLGGPLSHAAIVAREFGIPTVVGATGATTRLRTGDRVRVDPAAGTVQLV